MLYRLKSRLFCSFIVEFCHRKLLKPAIFSPPFIRFHHGDMNRCIIYSILLAYLASNCFCADDAPPKVFVPPEKYRLPRSVFPELYTLNVFTHINDDEGFKFYGDVRIKVIFSLFRKKRLLTCIFPAHLMCVHVLFY